MRPGLAARGMNLASWEYDHPRRLVPANVATVAVHLLVSLLIAVGTLIDRALT